MPEGMSRSSPIPPSKKIYDYSSGLPRMINRACTLSLSLAYQTNRLILDDRMVGEALEEEVT